MLLMLLLIILDQVSKYFLTTTINYGAAFSLFQGYTAFLIIISLIVLIACIYYYKEKKLRIGLNFLISGIVGNLIDRIYFGYVRDFINLRIFPVFNLADMFNIIGVIIIAYILLKK